MKLSNAFRRRFLPVLLLGSVLSALALGARRVTAARAANEAIAQAMGQINQSVKTLGKGITADSATLALEELVKIEQALIAAKGETPDTAAEVDEKKRADFVAEYRTSLLEVLKHVCDAEIAVLEGKYKEAEGILKGKLGSLKSAGHAKFQGDD
jgi:hypothetical protein